MVVRMDKAREISSELWRWFVELKDTEKTDRIWDRLLEQGKAIVRQYKNDEINYKLAEDLFFAFLEQIERLEKQKKGQ